jgi:hypothetical protein
MKIKCTKAPLFQIRFAPSRVNNKIIFHYQAEISGAVRRQQPVLINQSNLSTLLP